MDKWPTYDDRRQIGLCPNNVLETAKSLKCRDLLKNVPNCHIYWLASCLIHLHRHYIACENMSALANNFKMKFAGLLRGLLRRVDNGEDAEPQMVRPATIAVPQQTLSTPVAPVAPPPQPAIAPAPPSPRPARIANTNMSDLEMPLLPILEKLPPDVRSKWMLGGVDLSQASIAISLEKILPQLALGAVKITFGELRNAAPSLFRTGEEYDSLPIALPLNEVLARLNPAMIARNPAQRAVTAPPDIAAPFGPNAHGVTVSNTLLKPTPPTTHFFKKATPPPSEPIRMPLPPSVAQPLTATPLPFNQRQSSPLPDSTRPAAMTPRAIRPTPAMPIAPQPPISSPFAAQPPVPSHTPIQFSKPPAPAPRPTPPPESPGIIAPLGALSETWPETLRLEIMQLNLSEAQVALPVHLIEPALKRGRVIFSWHHLRSWIRPTPPGPSVHDTTELELPLQVLAPLFFSRQKNGIIQARPALPPSSVPNLFFGFPQPQPEELAAPLNAPEAGPVVKPVDAKLAETNYYVWGDSADAPRMDDTDYKRAPMPATDFTSRRATPKEIVERAMKLPGVHGAVVALPDGLKVAHQLPPELNPDTVSAFLPQLFSRVSQCSKELRMGELNNLNFTIGHIPWKIFRVNSVYFAAFGRAGEALPTAQLALLAGELDRKK